MEILRIGKFSLKISLNNVETEKYKLLTANEKNDELNMHFLELLARAREKVDFSYEGRKLFTEIYPSKDGGCDIFISTIEKEVDNLVHKDKVPSQDNRKTKFSTAIYQIKDFKSMLKICYRLKQIGFKGKCAVYYTKEAYYFIFEDFFAKELRFAFLKEYGKQIKNTALNYIIEHCKCIIKKNTINVLSNLVN